MSDFLLLLGHFDSSNVLFELSFLDSVLIFDVFQSDLSFFLKISELIKIVEDKMLTSLSVDFQFNLMLLTQVLKFSLLIPQLGCLIF